MATDFNKNEYYSFFSILFCDKIEMKEGIKMEKLKNGIKEVYPYLIIIVAVVLFRTFIATPIRVNGPSMDTTLKDGQLMILNKLGKVEKGKIVVVDTGDDKIIKRVIAVPGESVYAKDGIVYVNDKKIEEKYTSSDTKDFEKVYLKKNEYFVMGDNRSVSMDSRAIGPISKKKIMGTTSFRFFPFTKFGTVK